MEINKAIAYTLVELRKSKKISQETLANAIDSHQVYISEIEKGKKLPSIKVLYNIATFYEMKLSDLIKIIENKI